MKDLCGYCAHGPHKPPVCIAAECNCENYVRADLLAAREASFTRMLVEAATGLEIAITPDGRIGVRKKGTQAGLVLPGSIVRG